MQKYLLSTLTTAIFLGTTSVSLAQTGPGLGRTDRLWGSNVRTGEVCTRYSNGKLSLRTGLGTNYTKLTEIPSKTVIPLFNGDRANDGFWWWKTEYNGYVGWVRSDYVCGDPQ